ncbi:mannitol-1-phosphate 5-dehydrogenase [Escherichia coli O78:H12 str. 00-3279]|nr:mannitol-1-phosphate 5-dehydrogenase [Escherichia coli O78:H12 str. 00-3279]
MPDATLARLIMPTSSVLCVCRIRRSRRIRQWCTPDLTPCTICPLAPSGRGLG